jgi:hypothetical protein
VTDELLPCSLFTQGLAGIQAVDVPGVENVSVHTLASELIQ